MKKSELILTAVKPPLDYLALVFAALGAYSIRYLPEIQKIRPVVFDLPFKEYFQISLGICVGWVLIFALTGLYSVSGPKKIRGEVTKIFIACSAGLAFVLGVMVFNRFLFDSRFIILAGWVLAFVFVSIERGLINLIQKFAYRFGFGVHRIVIIGNGNVADELKKEFSTKPGLGYLVVGQFRNFNENAKLQISQMVDNDQLDEIIQINPNANIEETNQLLDFITEHHLDFRYTADLLGTQLVNLEMTTYAGMPVVEVKKTRLDGWGRIYKRTFDIIGSVLLIIVTSPVMVITAILIKLDSKGPVLFKYKRIGQFGKPFTYFKFRSMFKGSHKLRFDSEFLASQQNVREGSPMIKFQKDPRITRVGRVIRRFSIDELPELFLSLIGKMSLVGPRPHEVEEVEKYQRHHKKVLTIKPGITGMAQVSGRSDLDFEKEVKLDTYYIENWSLGLDFMILLKTPLAVLKRRQTE
ncbi:MAG: sugar transferase [Candidatus Buchananbacteria bacterium]|nr:sugar transferase [Candidatus Buchananbacteria bacterium]